MFQLDKDLFVSLEKRAQKWWSGNELSSTSLNYDRRVSEAYDHRQGLHVSL